MDSTRFDDAGNAGKFNIFELEVLVVLAGQMRQ